MRKCILNFGFSVLFFCIFEMAQAQDFLNDPLLQSINFDSLEQVGFDDTTDIMEEDYLFDSSLYYSDPTALTDADWTKRECFHKNKVECPRDIDLHKSENPYILVYYDDFKTINKNIWKSNGNWDYFVEFGEPCTGTDGDGKQKALYLHDEAQVDNGQLVIKTRYNPTTIPWFNHQHDTNHWVNTERTFDYTSSRIEMAWAFDGSMDVSGYREIGDDEGDICVISKIKQPRDVGTWPAFWFMSYGTNPWDEFDMFEFFQKEQADVDKMTVTMHSTDRWGNRKGACRDGDYLSHPNNPHIYTLYWNSAHTSLYRNNSMKFIRHQFSRKWRIGKFPTELKKGKDYNVRKRYNFHPMKLNYNTGVYCGVNNPNLNTQMNVDYLAVYKRMPCAEDVTITEPNHVKIKNEVYNVITAKKATIDIPSTEWLLGDKQFLKIIANDTVTVQNLRIDPSSTFHIEMTDKDLCKDQRPNRRRQSPPPIRTGDNDADASAPPTMVNFSLIENDESNEILANVQEGKLTVFHENKSYTVLLFDMQGRCVSSFQTHSRDNQNTFDISHLGTALYILKVQSSIGKNEKSSIIFVNNDR